jgi:hypothetical protein
MVRILDPVPTDKLQPILACLVKLTFELHFLLLLIPFRVVNFPISVSRLAMFLLPWQGMTFPDLRVKRSAFLMQALRSVDRSIYTGRRWRHG